MKILKHGTLPEHRIYEGKCEYCGTVLEAEANELTSIIGESNFLTYYTKKGDCPLCNRLVFFRAQDE